MSAPFPSLLKKERGDMYYSTYYCSPSLTLLERENEKGVNKTPQPSRNPPTVVGGYSY